jgi:hypothetical protein
MDSMILQGLGRKRFKSQGLDMKLCLTAPLGPRIPESKITLKAVKILLPIMHIFGSSLD